MSNVDIDYLTELKTALAVFFNVSIASIEVTVTSGSVMFIVRVIFESTREAEVAVETMSPQNLTDSLQQNTIDATQTGAFVLTRANCNNHCASGTQIYGNCITAEVTTIDTCEHAALARRECVACMPAAKQALYLTKTTINLGANVSRDVVRFVDFRIANVLSKHLSMDQSALTVVTHAHSVTTAPIETLNFTISFATNNYEHLASMRELVGSRDYLHGNVNVTFLNVTNTRIVARIDERINDSVRNIARVTTVLCVILGWFVLRELRRSYWSRKP